MLYDAAARQIKLIDFGFATLLRATEPERTRDTRIWGTPLYMAPQLLHSAKTFSLIKADVWSVGITFWYMLLGFHPFHRCIRKHELIRRIDQLHLDAELLLSIPKFILQRLLVWHEENRPTLREALDIVTGCIDT